MRVKLWNTFSRKHNTPVGGLLYVVEHYNITSKISVNQFMPVACLFGDNIL